MSQPGKTSPKADGFSVEAFVDRAASLTSDQGRLLDAVWNQLVSSAAPFPIRGIPGIVGKLSLQQVLEGLNGGLIFEISDQGDRYLQLTLHGALLTRHGTVLIDLLIRLLDHVRALFERNSFIKEIQSADLIEQMQLEPTEARFAFILLRLGLPPGVPVGLAGWNQDGSSWHVRVSDEVIDLFNSNTTAEFLDDRLSAGYRQSDACLLEDRQRQILPSVPAMSELLLGTSASGSTSPCIPISRLDELKAISGRRFDCTRLLSMCEELNDCAARENPLAVILLTRTILNHVPPAFELETFAQVAANYGGGGSSFKKAAERLENHSRKVADRLGHMPIRDREVAPNMAEVNFAAELETILAEFCRVLK